MFSSSYINFEENTDGKYFTLKLHADVKEVWKNKLPFPIANNYLNKIRLDYDVDSLKKIKGFDLLHIYFEDIDHYTSGKGFSVPNYSIAKDDVKPSDTQDFDTIAKGYQVCVGIKMYYKNMSTLNKVLKKFNIVVDSKKLKELKDASVNIENYTPNSIEVHYS